MCVARVLYCEGLQTTAFLLQLEMNTRVHKTKQTNHFFFYTGGLVDTIFYAMWTTP